MGARFAIAVALSIAMVGGQRAGGQAGSAPPPDPAWAPAIAFGAVCAGCHGTDGTGGRAPALADPALLGRRTDRDLHDIIARGVPGTEMPAFRQFYSDAQIDRLAAYLRTRAAAGKAAPTAAPTSNPAGRVIRSEHQAFRIDVLAEGLETPWALAFLPDGRLLVTERPGRLRIVDRAGRLLPDPVAGTPTVWERQDSGLLDVAVHPDFRRNGLIYLAYAEVAPGHIVTAEEARTVPPGERQQSPPSMTVIVRGRIDARNRWVTEREIFRAPAALYTSSGSHYGVRLLFDGKGHLFFSLGDRGEMANAQRLDTPLGKIHRVNEDGTVPADNPFVRTAGAVATIWSYGHRNSEGLAFDPATGLLWESEHGPAGGDEINIIEKGHDYGWGVVSMGSQPGITRREAPGMDPPIAYYTPSIAPTDMRFYTGSRYPGWKGDLLMGGLVGQQLRRLAIKGRAIVAQEVVFSGLGRVRAMKTGPDGLLYLLLQNATGGGAGLLLSDSTPGRLVRLAPLP